LMEKSCVARAQATHEIVHGQLKLLRIFRADDLIAPLFCASRPIRPVIRRIKVLLGDLFSGLIENRLPLFFGQSIWSG